MKYILNTVSGKGYIKVMKGDGVGGGLCLSPVEWTENTLMVRNSLQWYGTSFEKKKSVTFVSYFGANGINTVEHVKNR